VKHGNTVSSLRKRASIAIHSFNRKEFATFITLLLLASVSGVWLLGILNTKISTEMPVFGGTLREGIVGAPRFVNPVLATTDADKDVTALVFSGLTRINEDGTIIPDLAENYSISPDGKTYTFTLKKDAVFQDKTKITADDVVYTITQIQNPLLDSPKRANWQGVDVVKIDDATVQFTLKQPFSPFLELTTVGILPSHLWKNLSPEEFGFSELNANAIGSGPYTVSSITRNTSGIPNVFTLRAFNKFTLGRPYIKTIEIQSYANEKELLKAIQNGDIDEAGGFSPENGKSITNKTLSVETTPLPRVFALFINQGQNPIFNDPAVVKAVENGINKQELIDQVLYGYGENISGPVPKVFLTPTDGVPETIPVSRDDIALSLEKAGWKIGSSGIREKTNGKTVQTLSFSIATADTPELTQATEKIKADLAILGFDVAVKVYSLGDLNQDIIRPRAYETLFFGQYITSIGSLYAFWHSQEVADPGLNVALVKDATIDKLLTDILATSPEAIDMGMYQKLNDTIRQKSNVAFIYAPLYIAAHKTTLHTYLPKRIVSPSDRFQNAYKWYIETDRVWNIFIK
jgi:peptide/nickel transport system substrate-binding protein